MAKRLGSGTPLIDLEDPRHGIHDWEWKRLDDICSRDGCVRPPGNYWNDSICSMCAARDIKAANERGEALERRVLTRKKKNVSKVPFTHCLACGAVMGLQERACDICGSPRAEKLRPDTEDYLEGS